MTRLCAAGVRANAPTRPMGLNLVRHAASCVGKQPSTMRCAWRCTMSHTALASRLPLTQASGYGSAVASVQTRPAWPPHGIGPACSADAEHVDHFSEICPVRERNDYDVFLGMKYSSSACSTCAASFYFHSNLQPCKISDARLGAPQHGTDTLLIHELLAAYCAKGIFRYFKAFAHLCIAQAA